MSARILLTFAVVLVFSVALFATVELGSAGAQTLVVNTTSNVQNGCDVLPGDCSLTEALGEVTTGDTVAFNIPLTDTGCVLVTGRCTISPIDALPTISANSVTIDGYSQPLSVENTMAVGSNASLKIQLDMTPTSPAPGLTVTGDNVTIRGIVFTNPPFEASAITLASGSSNARIEGNFVGTDASGTVDLSNRLNADGIVISDSDDNVIGGLDPQDRNLISGVRNGVRIDGGSTNNVVVNNYIGTDADGEIDLGNMDGVSVSDASPANRVGGSVASARNVISGNVNGVKIDGADSTFILGNHLGVDAEGTHALGNTFGVQVDNASDTQIGGVSGTAGNVVSANLGTGISVNNSDGTDIAGNFVGTTPTNTTALGNAVMGIAISNAPGTTIGGGQTSARNVVSGNGSDGVRISAGSDGSQVLRNYIGTDTTGADDIANDDFGLNIAASMVTVRFNLVSGNGLSGITPAAGDGVVIQGNRVGTQANGTSPLPNLRDGIEAQQNTGEVLIGGQGANDGNIIAFNVRDGIRMGDVIPPFASATINRNSIHSNGGLGISLDFNSTPNGIDAGDPDSGGNDLQNAPTLTAAATGSTLITGTLNSTPESSFRLEIFSNAVCDSSGSGEGRTFGGHGTLATDEDGFITFEALSPATAQTGDFITATVTDLTTGNTSEFSNCVQVVAGPTPSPTPSSPTPTPSTTTPTPTASPIPILTPGPSATVTDEPTPVPTPSLTPSGSATPTPSGLTASPSPSGAATPTSTPGPRIQGDVTCNGAVAANDSLVIFSSEVGIEFPTSSGCPELESGDPMFGDLDCDGDVDLDDAIAVLLYLAILEVEQEPGCREIGTL